MGRQEDEKFIKEFRVVLINMQYNSRGGGQQGGSFRGNQGANSIIPPQPVNPEPVQSATDYFDEMVDKVLKNLPSKGEKSLEYWLGRTDKVKCKLHPSKLSKSCR